MTINVVNLITVIKVWGSYVEMVIVGLTESLKFCLFKYVKNVKGKNVQMIGFQIKTGRVIIS